MKFTLETTPEQDAYLTDLNALSNPNGKTPVEDFTSSYLLDKLAAEVEVSNARKIGDAVTQFVALPKDSRDTIIQAIATEVAKVKP